MKKALLVIDMQNDFIDGTLGSAAAEATVPVIRKKIESYIREGYPVVATRDIHPEGYLTDVEGQRVPRHCIRGEKGAEITSAFSDFAFTLVVDKNNFMASPDEQQAIRDAVVSALGSEPDEVEVAGLCTDICVVSNALMARTLFPDSRITVDRSATAGTTPEATEASFTVMRSCLIDIL